LLDLQIGGSSRFIVNKNGTLFLRGGSTIRPSNGTNAIATSGVNGINFISNLGTSTANVSDFIFVNNQGNFINTSGTRILVDLTRGFTPSSGTGQYIDLRLLPTINQTGGANGITRGLYVNPTLTAAADWRSLEWSNNTGWGLYGAGTANNYLGGSLGIGSTSLANGNLIIGKSITGGTSVSSALINSTTQSDVTFAANGYTSQVSTQSANFALNLLRHFLALQGSLSNITAGGSVTSQAGFWAASTLTGATNNYGFFGDIAAATGRWNLYMNGTAANYLEGNTAIGTSTLASAVLTIGGSGTQERVISVNKTFTGGTSRFGILQYNTVNSDVTSTAINNYSQFATQAAAFTLTNARHYTIGDIALGAGSAVTNQVGYFCGNISSATNNYAFQGFITAGTGRWNLYMDGSANNYLAGSLGIGSTSLTGNSLIVGKNMTGATGVYGIGSYGQIQSDATNVGVYFETFARTASVNFNITTIRHYNATQGTFSNVTAGGAVTNQFGFAASSALIGATNNYGFFGDIAAASGRWNLYMNGTAANYINGVLTIGTISPNASAKVQIDSTTQGFLPPRVTTAERDLIATPAAGLVIFNTTTTKLECYDGAVWQAAW
jgi:hypothetical protein